MQPGDIVADRFRIERLAGSGGMGAVFLATDLTSDGDVALKVLNAGGAGEEARFALEARVLAGLAHRGIVRYVAHGRTIDRSPWLAMEWLEGEDLATRLERGPLGVEDTLEVGRRAGEALGAAHAAGVVHRDVKPSNLFLPGGALDRLKVLDFGIAKVRAAARALTRTGTALGTIAYMAPEQVRGDKAIDGRADVFALGCVLFECLTGRTPFEGAHGLAVLAKILMEEAPRLADLRPDVPPALDDLVARMLSKDPARRPAGGEAVAAELSETSQRAFEAPAARPRSTTLTAEEQRVVCMIFIGAHEADDHASARTLTPDEASAPRLRLERAVAPYTLEIEALSDGSSVLLIEGRGSARDQAAQAARCALATRDALPDATIVAATGWAVLGATLPLGEVIDRAAALLDAWMTRDDGARRGRVGLDEVTAGLLDERFEVAREAAWIELRGERSDGIEAIRTLLGKPTPCVGRDREIATLEAIFAECVAEPAARVALVTGPAGIGKSRVRHELVRRLRRTGEDMTLWVARGDPMSAGSPFGMLAQVLRRAADIHDGDPLPEARDKLHAFVAASVPRDDAQRVTEFLGEIAGTPFPGAGSLMLDAARREPRLMGDQIQRAWEDLVAAECARRPIALVLEDLHWGDLPSVQLVDATLRASRERPLMVLALARPDVHERFPGLWAARGAQEIRLVELSRKASERLIRHMLGDSVDREVTERVTIQAEGNAFYLEELIRGVAEGKKDALPATLLAMVQTRLDALSTEERRALRAASVFGEVFWRGAVCALLGEATDADAVGERLQALSDREIVSRRLESRFAGEVEYAFRHDLIREAVSATLTDTDRASGHRAAGAWLEGAGEHDARALAEHFDQGGDPARAIRWYAAAAMQALEGNDLEAARLRAERGVALGASGAALGRLRFIETEVRQWMGDFRGVEVSGAEALRWLDPSDADWFSVAGSMVRAACKRSDTPRVVELAERLRAGHAVGEAARARVIALTHAAAQLDNCGLSEQADALLVEIEDAASRIDADLPIVRAMMARLRANRFMAAGDNASFLALRAASMREFERAGDVRNACAQRANVGYGHIILGAFEEAALLLRASLSEAERERLNYVAAMSKHNLGIALAYLGELDEARALESDAVEMFKIEEIRRLLGCSLHLTSP